MGTRNDYSKVPHLDQVDSLSTTPSTEHYKSNTPEFVDSNEATVVDQSGKWSRWRNDYWWDEVASLILGIIALGAICAVLAAYDGQPVPRLPHGITLNAIVSFLATIAKACLVLPLASVIGQGKWLWFLNGHKLRDIQTLDAASRGPMGALQMLATRRGGFLVCLSAAAVVLSIGFDPFVQQLITYPLRQTSQESNLARVRTMKPPRAHHFAFSESTSAINFLDLPFWSAVQSGIYDGQSSPRSVPSCPHGSCEWPVYHSLAFCSKCVNMTDHVTMTTQLGSQVPMNATRLIETYLDLFELGPSTWLSGTYAGIKDPLLALGSVTMQWSTDGTKVELKSASECALTLCTKVNGTTVTSSILSTTYGEVQTNSGLGYATWSAVVNDTTYFLSDGINFAPNSPDGAGENGEQLTGIIQTMLDVTVGNKYYVGHIICTVDQDNSTNRTVVTKCYTETEFDGTGYSSTEMQIIDSTPRGLEALLENIAAATTDLFQRYGNVEVTGFALTAENFVQTRWWWISLPAAVVLMAMVSLAATMYTTKRRNIGIWKTALLPVIFRGPFVEHSMRGGGEGERISEMKKVAKGITVKLVRDGDRGLRLRSRNGN
ncbi:uncharacterized protein Z520_02276 [Fonsecaea multimorphosa CBS 102226]|uniref:Uncharacterized protein n=1 Tax=Fonsecaea multimorphosa CBS 102226 TaxID=1442371 RepID=A0A0D2K7U4_9EURO|nr:uncharacterized protein Z520_02276 [Fonsecaea multimorphosa CBS 102226]KIY02138.1 hypothetical protein Z520_02276 [Fonsecaea multimorphosa CBS 102226]